MQCVFPARLADMLPHFGHSALKSIYSSGALPGYSRQQSCRNGGPGHWASFRFSSNIFHGGKCQVYLLQRTGYTKRLTRPFGAVKLLPDFVPGEKWHTHSGNIISLGTGA